MAAKKVTVVISQSQGKNPIRRNLEEEIAAHLMMEPEVNVSLVPHLYDMSSDHSGVLFLRSVPGDLVVLSWLYPRAARWTLDRMGVHGEEGVSLLRDDESDEEDADDGELEDERSDRADTVASTRTVPKRALYCIDLRVAEGARPFLDEVRRITREKSVQTFDLMQWIQGAPKPQQLERYLHPDRLLAASKSTAGAAEADPAEAGPDLPEPVKRRWYPVIDYTRCTNCMECLDFCLFGVYGVDSLQTILVEQQDNCKKGCPACSRVCPENAIIFPGHKTPAIAGADGEVAGLKIDLSALFGAPSAIDVAAQERDAELVRDGRDPVGLTVGIPKRQTAAADRPRDALDSLMDGLDQLDL